MEMDMRCTGCGLEMSKRYDPHNPSDLRRECKNCGVIFTPKEILPPYPPPEQEPIPAPLEGPPSMFERNQNRYRYRGYLKAHENDRHG